MLAGMSRAKAARPQCTPSRPHVLGVLLVAAAATGCGSTRSAVGEDADLRTAEAFIDAFYAFDAARLRAALAAAPAAQPVLVYYQGWAEGGHYQVVERQPCRRESAGEVRCSITVKDDLIGALGLDMHVTDTFHLAFSDGKLVDARTSSNDPPAFEDALQWVKRERAELVEVPCRGFFAGGPTPGDCVRAVVRGFAEYAGRQR